ncbi:RNA-directed DNA polymerase, eukaryota, reverse transcriptase zinc-binding domain protein [Tanacetum coccineum]
MCYDEPLRYASRFCPMLGVTTLQESILWSKDMIEYFKERWEKDRIKENNSTDMEDVLEANDGIANVMKSKEVSGIEGENEVMNLIKSENLKVCVVLETRLKSWDIDSTSVQILHQTSQSIFCVISAKSYNFKCFYTFVYAANDGLERRDLWEELIRECRYVNGKPWCIAGDINVTLYPNEHSSGSSVMSLDMIVFLDFLNKIEVDDICKSGLHFTWTKNLQSTKAGNMIGILKKLDRVISNEEFINQYPKAHAKFSNFLTDKHEFLPIVKEKWSKEVKGFYMYQVVQNMKSLKSPLNNLRWCKGSLFKRVVSLRDELKKQAKIKWLSEGDKNTSYFHKVLKGRSNKRKIFSLTDAKGEVKDYRNLFQNKISNEVALNMIAKVSDSKIMRAMFDIEDSKAPGLDGFTAAFFKSLESYWQRCLQSRFTINVNGERIVYFKEGRGLRQGDPISPYLFTLIMEIFSLLLQRQINNHPSFQYHFGCKPIKLVHVCFADDLLVMCHGDSYFVRVIKNALDEFSACSGLLPNNSKSTVFFGSLSKEERSEIMNVIPFTTRKLPVRYLGVPVIAKRLSVKDHGCLLDKIKSKIRNWKNRCLSYAGRLQLIDVVLESIHVYWALVFLLPITTIKEINKLLKWFLWNQGESAKGKAKFAWKDVCRPKDQDLNHLLFKCSNAKELWNKVTVITDIHTSSLALNDIVHTLINARNGNNIRSIIRRLAFAASIYSIWQERNGRIFRDSKRSCDDVFKNNIMDGINIDDLTVEQYLRLTQENQTPSMVKKSLEEELRSKEDLDEWLKTEMEKHIKECRDVHKNKQISALEADLKRSSKAKEDTINNDSFTSNFPYQPSLEELNPGSFLLPFTIDNYNSYAMANIDAVEMDDMTQQETLGTVKNVLVKIDKFEFPCDFVVIDMPENLGEMIILGRPFL